jgi:hypothetical protein
LGPGDSKRNSEKETNQQQHGFGHGDTPPDGCILTSRSLLQWREAVKAHRL